MGNLKIKKLSSLKQLGLLLAPRKIMNKIKLISLSLLQSRAATKRARLLILTAEIRNKKIIQIYRQLQIIKQKIAPIRAINPNNQTYQIYKHYKKANQHIIIRTTSQKTTTKQKLNKTKNSCSSSSGSLVVNQLGILLSITHNDK